MSSQFLPVLDNGLGDDVRPYHFQTKIISRFFSIYSSVLDLKSCIIIIYTGVGSPVR